MSDIFCALEFFFAYFSMCCFCFWNRYPNTELAITGGVFYFIAWIFFFFVVSLSPTDAKPPYTMLIKFEGDTE